MRLRYELFLIAQSQRKTTLRCHDERPRENHSANGVRYGFSADGALMAHSAVCCSTRSIGSAPRHPPRVGGRFQGGKRTLAGPAGAHVTISALMDPAHKQGETRDDTHLSAM